MSLIESDKDVTWTAADSVVGIFHLVFSRWFGYVGRDILRRIPVNPTWRDELYATNMADEHRTVWHLVIDRDDLGVHFGLRPNGNNWRLRNEIVIKGWNSRFAD